MVILLILAFFSVRSSLVDSFNILLVTEGFSDSHVLFNYRMANSMKNSGHNVSLMQVEHFLNLSNSEKHFPVGVEKIVVSATLDSETKIAAEESFQTGSFHRETLLGVLVAIAFVDYSQYKSCEKVLNSSILIKTLAEKQFDFILSQAFDYCPLYLADLLKIKVIWHSAVSIVMPGVAMALEIPMVQSYVPNGMGDSSDQMTFWERLENFCQSLILQLSYVLFIAYEEQLYQKYSPFKPVPTTSQLLSNVEVVFQNGELWLEFPRPLIHGLKYLGEVGVSKKDNKSKKELDANWQKIVNSSPNGFIFFSLGSVTNTTRMPNEMINGMFNAFKDFPEYTIIWRMEKVVPGVEHFKHIHIVKWAPQPQLLRHPKIKLFITHCGYNSFLESVHAGVPILAVPLWADQLSNAAKAVRQGIGISINKMTMKDSTVVKNKIKSILTDAKYYENAEHVSRMIKDKFVHPDELFAKTLKYHHMGKWFPSLSAAQNMNIIQYHCLDVIALFLSVIGTLAILSWSQTVQFLKFRQNCQKK